MTTKTLRRRVFALVGRITRSARRLTLHLPRRWPWETQFSRALARLQAIPWLTQRPRKPGPLDSPHRPGSADRDHQDPQAAEAGLRSGGTDHPLGAPPHFDLHLPRRWPWETQFSRALARLQAIPPVRGAIPGLTAPDGPPARGPGQHRPRRCSPNVPRGNSLAPRPPSAARCPLLPPCLRNLIYPKMPGRHLDGPPPCGRDHLHSRPRRTPRRYGSSSVG